MKKLIAGFLLVIGSVVLSGSVQSSSAQPAIKSASAQALEKFSVDTPKTTVLGNAFIAPKDWSIRVKGPATILEAPEGDSWVALVDVQAKSSDEALAAAWQAYKPDAKWPVKVSNDLADRDGWSKRRAYEYQTSPNEKRGVAAVLLYSRSSWTVVIEDLADECSVCRGSVLAWYRTVRSSLLTVSE